VREGHTTAGILTVLQAHPALAFLSHSDLVAARFTALVLETFQRSNRCRTRQRLFAPLLGTLGRSNRCRMRQRR
jgi:hypothetical protein